MAKSSSKRLTTSTARGTTKALGTPTDSWLSVTERKILDSTLGRALAQASQQQLRNTMVRTRTLRDKWRDLFNRQTLATKRARGPQEAANTRSLDKTELFAAAMNRVEARLTELAGSVAKAMHGKTSVDQPTKAARTAQHRATRASMRGSLAEMTVARNAKARRPAAKKASPATKKASPATKKASAATKKASAATKKSSNATKKASAAARKAGAKALAAASSADRQTTTATTQGRRKAPTTTISKKARQAGTRKKLAAVEGAVGFDKKKQRSANTSAMSTRIKIDGLTTRRLGSLIATGKRKQARRDGR